MNAPARLVPVGDGLKREKLMVDVAAVLSGFTDGLLDHLDAELAFLPTDHQPVVCEAIRRERLHRRLKPQPKQRTVEDAIRDFGDAFHERRAQAARDARKPYRDD